MNALEMVRKELRMETEAQIGVQRKVQKASQVHRKAAGGPPDQPTEMEKQMRARAIHDNSRNVLFTLRELANEFPEMQSALMMTLQKEKLHMPSRPPSRASSARSAGSAAGSAASGGAASVPQKQFNMGL